MTEYQTYGRHLIADFWGIEFDKINNIVFLKDHMKKAAQLMGATILLNEGWKFDPHGASVVVVLSESHLSIHTYPEKGFAAIDGYTCGEKINPEDAIRYLKNILLPTKVYTKKIIRGTGELISNSSNENE